MEEQRDEVVEMKSQESKPEQPKKMSYEQLEQVAHQLSEQARQLYDQLQKSNMNNMFKRLDYLFKVLENEKVFKQYLKQDFVDKCVNEIEDIMIIPDEPNSEENKLSDTNSEK